MSKIRKIKIFLLTLISCAFLISYLIWRILFTLPLNFKWSSIVVAFMLLFAEILGIFDTFVYYYNINNFCLPVLPKINDDLFPDVDIFITVFNEPVKILQDTAMACLKLKYPGKNKVHVFICDDGDRNEIKIFAKKNQIGYFSRKDRKNAKSGNLNNALFKTKSKLVANFDVDMIPCENFLMETVPYFFIKTKDINYSNVGFVQTPQNFYEPDLFQKYLFSENFMHNEQDYFYKNIQISKNKSNSVIYGGTNAIFLRKALEEIGGFSSISITEDFATGIIIQTRGYVCYAIDKILASGIPPRNLESLCKQRRRWACGCIQTGKRLRILTRNDLTLRQKINHFSSILYWYFPIKQFLYLIVPILFSLFGVISAKCDIWQSLVFWLPMIIITSVSLRILSKNTRTFHQTRIYETTLSPVLIIPVICEFLGISNNEFVITEKKMAQDSIFYKIKFILPNLILSIFTVIGIKNCFKCIILNGDFNQFIPIFWLILNLYFLSVSMFFAFGRTEKNKRKRFSFLKDISKKVVLPLFLLITCIGLCYPTFIVFKARKRFPEMKYGINIGNALEAPKGMPWDFEIKNSYFDEVKKRGFDNVRIPVRFSDYADDEGNIETYFLEEVKNYVDYALNLGLSVTLDLHHFLEIMQNPLEYEKKFYNIWENISKSFKDYPQELVFELLNEPSVNLDYSTWNRFISNSIGKIRESNRHRIIIVGPCNFYNIDYLIFLEIPKNDPYIMVAIHYYEPYIFAFQGNKWHPGYDKLSNINWNGSKKELEYLSSRFEKVALWAREKQVKVVLNEFGVTKEAPKECRELWIKSVVKEALKNNFGYCYWELGSGFGIYDTKNNEWNETILDFLINNNSK
ncbi:MAG: glycosyltransferase [Candidatus Improbicoccus pseudotrichonymphae]|uniref:Glycosyltransferase n=1 Tax=Candidatus Improbicoccus pseudotrichonymphae TaxID=3033792 RepID=A0AA48I1X1_9FIRM|nr:MAG: glycosyltransferase [Candidatus Improbicoccus pseudotrichonymphae]